MSKNKLVIFLILLAIIAIVVVVIKSVYFSTEHDEQQFYSMNTIIDIEVWGENSKSVTQSIIQEVNRLSTIFDDYSQSSEVYKINSHAGVDPVIVSQETSEIFQIAKSNYYKTNGAFNVMISPIARIWGFKGGEFRVPTEEEINEALELTDINDLEIAGSTVFLKKKGEAVDLGGIAKGYALDKIYEILKMSKAKSALINFGGSVLTYGTPDGGVWKIGVKNPRGEGISGILKVTGDKFISTSGDYERFFIQDETRYCHIFDPSTGLPAKKIVSITVVGDEGYLTDILSTAFFVLGKESSTKLSENMGVEILGFDNELKFFATKWSSENFEKR